MGSLNRSRRLSSCFVVAVLAIAAGCYYRRYDPLVRTHVDLMVALAEKRRDLVEGGLGAPNPAEFRYPLERARDFARIVRDRFGERGSFRAFEAFLAVYERSLAGQADLEELRRARQAVTTALDAERG